MNLLGKNDYGCKKVNELLREITLIKRICEENKTGRKMELELKKEND